MTRKHLGIVLGFLMATATTGFAKARFGTNAHIKGVPLLSQKSDRLGRSVTFVFGRGEDRYRTTKLLREQGGDDIPTYVPDTGSYRPLVVRSAMSLAAHGAVRLRFNTSEVIVRPNDSFDSLNRRLR